MRLNTNQNLAKLSDIYEYDMILSLICDIDNYLMSNTTQSDLVLLALDNYLTKTDKVNKEELSQLNRIAEHYSKNNQHKRLVNYIFQSFKKCLGEDNFVTTCKRYLILLDDMLEQSVKKSQYRPYSEYISSGLIDCYTYVFSLIFQYNLLEVALDWKVYRMLWAKSINDVTFDSLRYKFYQSENKSAQNLEILISIRDSLFKISKELKKDTIKKGLQNNKSKDIWKVIKMMLKK